MNESNESLKTSPRQGEWSRATNHLHFHFFHPVGRRRALCGMEVWMRTESTFTGIPTNACERCKTLYLEELTAEARIIHEACGKLWLHVNDDTRKVARYIVEERSKLATSIAEMRARIDALYIAPQAE